MYNIIIKMEEIMKGFFVICAFILFIPYQIFCSILGFDEVNIIFNEDSLNNDVLWSSHYNLSDKGLFVFADTGNVQHNLWIKSHGIPLGLAFRPPSAVNIYLTINGELGDSFPHNIYFRYGCDRVHWSTWYKIPLLLDSSSFHSETFYYQLILPEPARTKYNDLMTEWRGTDPVWTCDETAFCQWISENYPDFFTNEFPFIGYLQFYIDTWWLNYPVTVYSINTQMIWGVGGLMTIPDNGVEPDTESKWYFDLR